MLVKWNGQGPLSIGDPRTGSNYKLAAVIVVLPGVNKLPDDVWLRAMKKGEENPVLARLLKKGSKGGLEIVRGIEDEKTKAANAKRAEDKSESPDLVGLTPEKAVRIVKQTLNKDLLEQWAESDNRPAVRRAVEQQLKVLELTPSKNKSEDEDDESIAESAEE
jgi:hypothetical protein